MRRALWLAFFAGLKKYHLFVDYFVCYFKTFCCNFAL